VLGYFRFLIYNRSGWTGDQKAVFSAVESMAGRDLAVGWGSISAILDRQLGIRRRLNVRIAADTVSF